MINIFKIFDSFKKTDEFILSNITSIRNGGAVFDYPFMMSLAPKDYAKYLCHAYYIKTGKKLNLKHPKTLNEKIQWLKIYDNQEIKSKLTDKVLVRDFIKDKIGDEYLKPVLWIGDKFDDIPFYTLPDSFIVKCNHGCKWQFIIKNKEKFLDNKKIFKYTKMVMDNWLIQSFFGYSDFETQYINIKPKIIIEKLLQDENEIPLDIEMLCFNGLPFYTSLRHNSNIITNILNSDIENESKVLENISKNFNFEFSSALKTANNLSKILAKDFKCVRIDWMLYKDKLYFVEMTFTPYSGYIFFSEKEEEIQCKLGKMINLKGN